MTLTFVPSLYNNNVQNFQNKDTAIIITEMIHDARIVQIGERLPLDEKIGLWTGDSRGYWEGDTLVVDARNFNGLRTATVRLVIPRTSCLWRSSIV